MGTNLLQLPLLFSEMQHFPPHVPWTSSTALLPLLRQGSPFHLPSVPPSSLMARPAQSLPCCLPTCPSVPPLHPSQSTHHFLHTIPRTCPAERRASPSGTPQNSLIAHRTPQHTPDPIPIALHAPVSSSWLLHPLLAAPQGPAQRCQLEGAGWTRVDGTNPSSLGHCCGVQPALMQLINLMKAMTFTNWF